MPGGVPIELTPEQAALYASVGSMIGQGIGADRAFGILRDTGAYIPRATVRAMAGEVRASLGFRRDLGGLNPDANVPARLVSELSTLRTADYLHKVQMILFEPITGTTFTQMFTYRSPELVSPDEIYSAIAEGEDGSPSYQEYSILSMSLVAVETAR